MPSWTPVGGHRSPDGERITTNGGPECRIADWTRPRGDAVSYGRRLPDRATRRRARRARRRDPPARLAVPRSSGDGDTTGVFRAYRMTGGGDSGRRPYRRATLPGAGPRIRGRNRTGCSEQEI